DSTTIGQMCLPAQRCLGYVLLQRAQNARPLAFVFSDVLADGQIERAVPSVALAHPHGGGAHIRDVGAELACLGSGVHYCASVSSAAVASTSQARAASIAASLAPSITAPIAASISSPLSCPACTRPLTFPDRSGLALRPAWSAITQSSGDIAALASLICAASFLCSASNVRMRSNSFVVSFVSCVL